MFLFVKTSAEGSWHAKWAKGTTPAKAGSATAQRSESRRRGMRRLETADYQAPNPQSGSAHSQPPVFVTRYDQNESQSGGETPPLQAPTGRGAVTAPAVALDGTMQVDLNGGEFCTDSDRRTGTCLRRYSFDFPSRRAILGTHHRSGTTWLCPRSRIIRSLCKRTCSSAPIPQLGGEPDESTRNVLDRTRRDPFFGGQQSPKRRTMFRWQISSTKSARP